ITDAADGFIAIRRGRCPLSVWPGRCCEAGRPHTRRRDMKTLTKILMALSMSFGLAACGPDGDSPAPESVHPVDPAMPTRVAELVGSWRYESIDAWISCSNGKEGPFTTVSGTETF